MYRQIDIFLRVVSKRDPLLRMLCLACLVLISIVAADQIYINDQIARIKESSSQKSSSSHNGQMRNESVNLRTHFNIIKENKNQYSNKIDNTYKFSQVSNSNIDKSDNKNSLDNNINNNYRDTTINSSVQHESPFGSYKKLLSLFFNEKGKDNPESNILNKTETTNSINDSFQKTIAPVFNEKSNQDIKSKTISNKTKLPWEVLFTTDRSDHGTWNAYFYDQAIAVMLLDEQDYVYNCTLIEVIKVYEQREALDRLGKLMPLVPVSMPDMVHLITLCGSLDIDVQKVQEPRTQDVPMWWMSANLLRGLMPGTLWCGMGDAAENYHQLGYLSDLDNCCRAHDHCPIKLKALVKRYGLTNLAVNTKSHCSCDLEFFRCLKAVGSEISSKVGEVYFNYLRIQCIDEPPVKTRATVSYSSLYRTSSIRSTDTSPRLTCIVKDVDGACRKWILNPKSFNKKLVIKNTDLVF